MEWLTLLNEKANTSGRRQVEKDLGVSRTTLSQVLNHKYLGNMDNIKEKVLAAYTNAEVFCPVLGDIPVKRCLTEQIKPFSPANPQRIQLYKTCMSCPNRRQNHEKK